MMGFCTPFPKAGFVLPYLGLSKTLFVIFADNMVLSETARKLDHKLVRDILPLEKFKGLAKGTESSY